MAGAGDAGITEGKKTMHVLMVALPVTGHINPMLHLSFKLASHGVRVTFFNSEFNRAKMKIPSDQPHMSNVNFMYIPDGLPPEHGRTTNVLELLNSLEAVYAPNCAALLEKLAVQDPPVTCVVGNTFVSHVQEATTRLNLPYVSFWTQSAAHYATVLLLVKSNMLFIKDAILSDAVPSHLLAPGVPPNLKYDDVHVLLLLQDPSHILSKVILNPFDHIAEADYILLNTFKDLEEETLAFLKEQHHPVLPVGPILPCSYLTLQDDAARSNHMGWVAADQSSCLEWLDKQEERSVIYVSFGSMMEMSEEQIEEMAMGLEASRQPFLWVVTMNLTAPEARGGKVLLEGFMERTAGRQGLVVPWAPQLSVLCHKAVGGFLTHCGWNSIMEALSVGMPMLAWPCRADQSFNCKLLVDKWGAGLKMMESKEVPPLVEVEGPNNRSGLVSRQEVAKKVVELMQHSASKEHLCANAAKWRAKAVKSVMDRDGSSSINLQHFLDFLA